jgi:hypothetical protein
MRVFLILNSVPVTNVTDTELIRPSIYVMTHYLNQKVMARKTKASRCTAELAGNVLTQIVRQAQACEFNSCHPTSHEHSPKEHQSVCGKKSS